MGISLVTTNQSDFSPFSSSSMRFSPTFRFDITFTLPVTCRRNEQKENEKKLVVIPINGQITILLKPKYLTHILVHRLILTKNNYQIYFR